MACLTGHMTLDSGAARSIVRTSFADQLRKTRETRGELYGPQPFSRTVNIEGITEGRTSELTQATQIRVGLVDSAPNRHWSRRFLRMCGCPTTADPTQLIRPG